MVIRNLDTVDKYLTKIFSADTIKQIGFEDLTKKQKKDANVEGVFNNILLFVNQEKSKKKKSFIVAVFTNNNKLFSKSIRSFNTSITRTKLVTLPKAETKNLWKKRKLCVVKIELEKKTKIVDQALQLGLFLQSYEKINPKTIKMPKNARIMHLPLNRQLIVLKNAEIINKAKKQLKKDGIKPNMSRISKLTGIEINTINKHVTIYKTVEMPIVWGRPKKGK